MDPQSSEHSRMNSSSSVNDPQSVVEPSSVNPQNTPGAALLTGQGQSSSTQFSGQAMPTIPLPTITPTPQNSSQGDASATTQTVVPNMADDTDLIEKEWVSKAKQIVEHTREDPYEQSKELTVFKADYMKKRYNRTIKLSE